MSAWRLSSVLVVQTQVAPLEKGQSGEPLGGVLGTSREGELERKRYTFALSEVKCSSCTFSMSAWRLSSVLVVQTQVAPLEKGHIIPNIPASPQLWPCCFRNEAVLEKDRFLQNLRETTYKAFNSASGILGHSFSKSCNCSFLEVDFEHPRIDPASFPANKLTVQRLVKPKCGSTWSKRSQGEGHPTRLCLETQAKWRLKKTEPLS